MNKISIIIIAIAMVGCHRDLRDPRQRFVTIGMKEFIHSTILNEDREVWIYVPPYSLDSPKKFPVLYLLDGEAHFHSVSGLIQILGTGVNETRVVPEMIVVAIKNTDRVRDLTPTNDGPPEGEPNRYKTSGGAGNFLKFMQTELIPHIDSNYPTNRSRTLVGHSFGGTTVIHALYTTPQTFDAYIAIDPSIWWDDSLLLKEADTVFSARKFEDKYLYIAQANTLEPGTATNVHFTSIKEFVNVLESSKNTSGIKWKYKYYPDDTHGSVPFIAEYDGLRFIHQ